MTRPRSALVSLDATPYYHCIARCVRRSFFFGIDDKGRDLSYRKPWFLQRLKLLGEVFAVDIPAYALMSNHYHLILHIDQERAKAWSRDEVIQRWLKLYRGPDVVRRYASGEILLEAELQSVDKIVAVWRKRLCNLSWFMSCLNFYIALHANKEDGCTGHFWEGRFISQALLDAAALLSCMAYVDLNPVRAGMADSLEDSDFTSIQQRLRAHKKASRATSPALMKFSDEQPDTTSQTLPFGFRHYIELVQWTGHVRQKAKAGYVEPPAFLAAQGLDLRQWNALLGKIGKESSLMLYGLNGAASGAEQGSATRVA